jgi:hypothetical protein
MTYFRVDGTLVHAKTMTGMWSGVSSDSFDLADKRVMA